LQWHEWLFAKEDAIHPVLREAVIGGQLRGTTPMQVVSGKIDGQGSQTVHFEAPPRAQLDEELTTFLAWFNRNPAFSAMQTGSPALELDGKQNSLLGVDRGGFVDGISAAQYQKVAKVSKATATRHLADLLEKGCLMRMEGGGRSTRYQIRWK
jgi:Fic family protein